MRRRVLVIELVGGPMCGRTYALPRDDLQEWRFARAPSMRLFGCDEGLLPEPPAELIYRRAEPRRLHGEYVIFEYVPTTNAG